MKNKLLVPIALIALTMIVIFTGCEKEYFVQEAIDPNIPISFANDVQPIFTATCLGSSCHEGTVKPNLAVGKAYNDLINNAMVDTLNPETSTLMIKLNSNMPPAGKLPSGDIQKILNWIKQGALDN